ncbi:ABC transporter ATP-binding protein [Luethyella okanaganae]|uniref:ABC transporter ATP-binding protein n=1 Tax=Luethyella okanaganae TaxID=69372 RepID=A0ABW1VII8_9MICO
MVTMLDIQSVTKKYGKHKVLGPVSVSLEQGRYYALLGPNGAGKTTLLHIFMGLTSCSSGVVTVLGTSIDDPEARRHIGFSPDDVPFPESLTGWEFLELHNRLRKRDDSERCLKLSGLFQIKHALDQQIFEYSHGMRRKLQFVAAVSHEPALLALDEPFRGLDPRSSFLLRTFLQKYVDAGNTVLVATHDMLRAERDASELILLDNGLIRSRGSAADIRAEATGSQSLEEAFNALTIDRKAAAIDDEILADLTTIRR